MQAIQIICPKCAHPIHDNKWTLIDATRSGSACSDGPYHDACAVSQLEEIAAQWKERADAFLKLYADACAEDRRDFEAARLASADLQRVRRERNAWWVIAAVSMTTSVVSLLLAGWWKMRCGL